MYSLDSDTVNGILRGQPILTYTDETEALFLSWTPKQRRLGANDCRIAASAINANLIIVTCNQKDFSAIPGIQLGVNLEDWSF